MKKLLALTTVVLVLAWSAAALAQPFDHFNAANEAFYEQFEDALEYQLYNSVSANTGDATALINHNATNNALLTQANCGNALTGNVAYETKADASGGRSGNLMDDAGGIASTGGAGGNGGTATFDMGTSNNGLVDPPVTMSNALTGFTGVGANGQILGTMNHQLNVVSFAVSRDP
jgi:hypothetical protein